jgi:hypothetical protein
MVARTRFNVTFIRILSLLLDVIFACRFKHMISKTKTMKIFICICNITFIRMAIKDSKSTNKPFGIYVLFLSNIFTFKFRHTSISRENEGCCPNISLIYPHFPVILAILWCRSVTGQSGCHAHTPRSLTPVHVEFVGPFTEVIRTGTDVRRFPRTKGKKATQCMFCKPN